MGFTSEDGQESKRRLRVASGFSRRFAALPWGARLALLLLALPLAAGGASGGYYINMHRLCAMMTLAGLPDASFPNATQRLLVLSPHCDDETLGAGGLIADARRKGVPVQIVFFTNGDAFRLAANRSLGKFQVGRQDLIRFAEMRQTEAILAANELGVDSANVLFLGYPDQGLKPLWEKHWNDAFPYRSPYTGRDHCPYPHAVTLNAPYSGMSVMRDLRRVLKEFQPTEILVTHPADDHPDHSIAASFAQAALNAEKEGKAPWAENARLQYYIVHRGDWPYPQGLHPERPLLPPPGLSRSRESWSVYPITPEGEDAKKRALGRYNSQTAIMGRFLRSFIRTNELFTEGREALAQSPLTSSGPAAQVKDATGDTVARYADPSADITALSAQREGDKLRVCVTLRGAVSPRVRYRLSLRAESPNETTPDNARRFWTRELPARSLAPDKRTLEATIPLRSLGLPAASPAEDTLWASAETHWITNRSMPIDKTGYREFKLAPPPPSH